MLNSANSDDFAKAASLAEAAKGIINPQTRRLHTGEIIYRFGASLDNAKFGGWWLDLNNFTLVQRWATLNDLQFSHAARVLCAVHHEWGQGSRLGGNMTVLTRAELKQPLMAYEGGSKPQAPEKDANGVVRELIDPGVAGIDTVLKQLFVPGVSNPEAGLRALKYGNPVYIDVGASHIGGVPGIPAGAILQ
jgi:hypothetical protein